MAAIKFIDVRPGMILDIDGVLHRCVDRDFKNPGNWRAILQLTLKNLKTGSTTTTRYKPEDKVEKAYLEGRPMQYSYRDGDDFIFMDAETFDQVSLPAADFEEQMKYLKENDTTKVIFYDNNPIDIELPASVELEVTETEPSIKGATASAQTKPATLENGMTVTVPPFITEGDVLRVDTRTGEYIERAKK